MNRPLQLFLAACLLAFTPASSLKAQTLVLHHADGTQTDIELYTQPQVSFSGDQVLIQSDVLNMQYPKQDVLRFTYKGGSTSIGKPTAKASVSQEDGQLIFHGVGANDKVSVYTANGIRVPVNVTRSGSVATLPLSSIPRGAYLLSVNGRTSKFTRP